MLRYSCTRESQTCVAFQEPAQIKKAPRVPHGLKQMRVEHLRGSELLGKCDVRSLIARKIVTELPDARAGAPDGDIE